MGVRQGILLVATVVGSWTAGLAAQDSIAPGARVRLTMKVSRVSISALDTHTVVVHGRAVAVEGSALRLLRDSSADTVSVPLPTIVRLEMQTRESHAARGALIGGTLGAGLGLLVISDESSKTCTAPCQQPFQGIQYFAAAIFVIGGVVLGERIGRERWRRVPVPAIGGSSSSAGSPTVTLTLKLCF